MEDCIEGLCAVLERDLAAPPAWVSLADYCLTYDIPPAAAWAQLTRDKLNTATIDGQLMVQLSGFGARVLKRRRADNGG
jgi:hypothetical protein